MGCWFRFLYLLLMVVCMLPSFARAQQKHGFKIFQFPADRIPVIDGNTNDWSLVPENYSVGADLLRDDRPDSVRHLKRDPANINVSVKAGWVKGMNRLYFLYEASDNYWDFSHPDLHNDIFELVVDGDHSGGPFITVFHPHKNDMSLMDNYFSFQGVQAQNYHIFTPAKHKDWAMVWGSQTWIKEMPYANAKSSYNFKPGDSGKYTLEFWITPFDYAGFEGPSRAVETVLKENNTVGLCWAIIDYDDVNKKLPANNGFWNLSPEHTMYGNASYLMPFKLMPLEKEFRKELEAHWSFSVIDMLRRTVKFIDESEGKIDSWLWEFGDGNTSKEQHPVHMYKKGDHYVVTLTVTGAAGKSKFSRVWDVAVK